MGDVVHLEEKQNSTNRSKEGSVALSLEEWSLEEIQQGHISMQMPLPPRYTVAENLEG